jgi:hypothetical protein
MRSICSETTASVLRRDLDPGIRLVDLGIFRLRDVPAPERLFQIACSDIADKQFPAPNAEAAHTGAVPTLNTRFFGREAEIERLIQFLAPMQPGDGAPRLYSLTGPGGTGKTRLSLEVAHRLTGAYSGAVWFVPLADYTDARLIGEAIVDAMRLPRSPGRDPLDQVRARRALDMDVELGLRDAHAADGRCSNGSWVERTFWTSTTYLREVGGWYGNGSPV